LIWWKTSGSGRVGFKSICDGAIDTTTASGELIFKIFSSLAQFERLSIQERTEVGLTTARFSASFSFTGGRLLPQMAGMKANPLPQPSSDSTAASEGLRCEVNRRGFLRKSALASSAAALAFRFEEKVLLAQEQPKTAPPRPQPTPDFPRGRIRKLSLSRLICGGNLISGFAHSRDLLYVSPLLKHYFTDEKIFETLALCEAHGINTAILRLDDDTLRLLKTYWKERSGKIQWIAQCKIKEDDFDEIQQAVDAGAVAAYVHGGVGDDLVERARVDVLGKAVERIKKKGVLAGVAGHSLEVPKACERAKIDVDFYLKTFNSKRYWSAGPTPRNDSVWEETPQETAAFMQEVDKPWIAYKVLGAGAIHPSEGFRYAYQNGADFLCVGMFDFQVAEDVQIALNALDRAEQRDRPWCA
jgi:hypothetical protein